MTPLIIRLIISKQIIKRKEQIIVVPFRISCIVLILNMQNFLIMTFKSIVLVFILTRCFSTWAEASETDSLTQKNYVNYEFSLKKIVDSLSIKQSAISIKIDKKNYTLSVLNKDKVIKSYPIVLGDNPVDDKKMEGDMATPEGSFKMNSKYPHKSWKYFIWVNYPTKDSHDKFDKRKANGEIPKDAKIGGEIGIHGTPEDCDYLIDEGINWTWGCISLKRSDIADLYPYIAADTKIEIVK
ncbi:MAG: murein L,D-transpeptidase YafK [Parvicella sp.]